MIFEVTNHLLGFVPVVHVRRDQLEFCPPSLGNDPFEVCTGLVIPDVEINREPLCSQASQDDIEGGYTMFICLCHKGLTLLLHVPYLDAIKNQGTWKTGLLGSIQNFRNRNNRMQLKTGEKD